MPATSLIERGTAARGCRVSALPPSGGGHHEPDGPGGRSPLGADFRPRDPGLPWGVSRPGARGARRQASRAPSSSCSRPATGLRSTRPPSRRRPKSTSWPPSSLGSTGCRPRTSPGIWSSTTTRRRSAISSASRPAWRAWCWARTRSSARSAMPTRPPPAAGSPGRSSTPSSRGPCASPSGSARRPAWAGASSRSPASPSTSLGTSSTASTTRPSWSSAPARWATWPSSTSGPRARRDPRRQPRRRAGRGRRRRRDGRVVAFDRLDHALIEADIVISTTAAAEPIMTLDRYTRIQRPAATAPS